MLEVVGALHPSRRFAGRLYGRQQEGNQDPDDRDNDEEFKDFNATQQALRPFVLTSWSEREATAVTLVLFSQNLVGSSLTQEEIAWRLKIEPRRLSTLLAEAKQRLEQLRPQIQFMKYAREKKPLGFPDGNESNFLLLRSTGEWFWREPRSGHYLTADATPDRLRLRLRLLKQVYPA